MLIVTVSMVSSLAGFVAAVVVVLVVDVSQWLGTGFTNDALLMKNLTFFFGHVLVNITMYRAWPCLFGLILNGLAKIGVLPPKYRY